MAFINQSRQILSFYLTIRHNLSSSSLSSPFVCTWPSLVLCIIQTTEKALSNNNFPRSRTVHYSSHTPPFMAAKRLRARATSLLLIREFPLWNLGMETGDRFYIILIVVFLRPTRKNVIRFVPHYLKFIHQSNLSTCIMSYWPKLYLYLRDLATNSF
jgi:hypothetical protein